MCSYWIPEAVQQGHGRFQATNIFGKFASSDWPKGIPTTIMRGPDVDTSERPFVLVWEVTQACELECDHCRAEAQPERDPDELTTTEGKRFIDSIAAAGPSA